MLLLEVHSLLSARALIEKVASSHSWIDEHTQNYTRMVHQLEEVDMLTAKIDLLMKKLEDPSLDHLKMVDACMTCEDCGEMGHMGVNCPLVHQDVNFVGNSNNDFRSNEGFNLGWNKPNFPSTTANRVIMGRISIGMSPFSEIVRNQLRVKAEFSKKLLANDKFLENIDSKMNNFIVTVQNQLNFYKLLETQIV
jgi:hypothetical protein